SMCGCPIKTLAYAHLLFLTIFCSGLSIMFYWLSFAYPTDEVMQYRNLEGKENSCLHFRALRGENKTLKFGSPPFYTQKSQLVVAAFC
ncbi:hypothetical protein PMAYCL1PPCAC_03779, partial [Pristionchus mayeri]